MEMTDVKVWKVFHRKTHIVLEYSKNWQQQQNVVSEDMLDIQWGLVGLSEHKNS